MDMSEETKTVLKTNWPLMISIVSPLVMILGLVGTAAVYKDRVDAVTQYLNPAWLVEYGKLQQRVTHMEEQLKQYEALLNERSFKIREDEED